MATDKQIAANRENAQKSTGPNTNKGKAISSRNALKTGIDVTSELIRPESKAEFDQLETEYYEDFAPANAIERALVDQLIRNEWLLRRYAAVELSVWDLKFRHNRNEDLGEAFFYTDKSFLNLDRIRNSAQRNYYKALKELKALRKERGADIPVHESAAPPKLASFDNFSAPIPDAPEPEILPAEEDPPIAA